MGRVSIRVEWTLVASYKSGGREHTAPWRIHTKAQTVEARNDEAAWLTENQISALSTRGGSPILSPPKAPRQLTSRRLNEKISVIDAQPSSAKTRGYRLDACVSNSKRGTSQPMPDEPEFDGAHPAHSEPEAAVDATILEFPSPSAEADSAPVPSAETAPSLASVPSAESASRKKKDDDQLSGQQTLPGVPEKADGTPTDDELAKPKKARRRNRPAMPSWDEIVFGYSKDN